MNATERAALLQGLAIHDEMTSVVDERTLEILERRRRMTVVKGRGWLVRRTLLAADLTGLIAAMLLAEWLVNRHNRMGVLNMHAEIMVFLFTLPGWVVVAKLYGLYDHDEERTDHSTADDFAGVFHMVTVCTWLVWTGAYLTGLAHPTPPKLLIFWAAAIAFVTLGRASARSLTRRNPMYVQNAVIVGAGDVGQLIAKKLLQHPEYGINLVGFVDVEPKERREDLDNLALLGGTERLPAIVRLFDVDRVVIAFSNDSHQQTLDLIRSLKDLNVQVDIVPRLFELVGPGMDIHTVEGLPLVGLPPARLSNSSRLLKRSMDVIVSIIGLLLLAPVFVVIAIAIKFDSRGSVLFRQVRMGERGHTFSIFKFRTMSRDAEERKSEVAHLNKHAQNGGDPRMFKIPNDPRITIVGRFLRRYSIDELPQLINVVRGEMSLVGPRPLILKEDEHVREWARERLSLRPGITGPWQVSGRSGIPFEEMVRLDYLYVTSWSLFTDFKLILRTIPEIFRNGRAY
jgi:exopolysaccharide biosynthesis polyprenyl glycosylphosphotransferase